MQLNFPKEMSFYPSADKADTYHNALSQHVLNKLNLHIHNILE